MKSKRITSLTLSFVLASSLLTPTLAVNTSGGTGNSEAVVSQDSTHFSVTVPSGLPIAVDKEGKVTVADNAKIINNSYGPVKVSNVSVTPLNSWSIVDYAKDFSKEKIGLKEFGFILNGDEVTIDGNLELTEGSWSTISGKSELDLSYNANLGVQKVAQNIDIANVVFTVGWDSANLDFSLSSDSLSIEKGNSGKLSLIGVQTAVWSSSNESVATVDQDGNIETLDWGTTVITATANGFTHTCEVTVPKIQTGLTMSQATASLEKGKTLQLSTTSNYRGTIVWSSSNDSIVSVSQTGLVTSKNWGTATITATQGNFKATCEITVPKIQTGLTMSQASASLEKGNTLQLSATSNYRGTIVWSSSDASIASVDSTGLVTGNEWGTATITATQGDFKTTCEITVPKIQTSLTMSQATASLKQGVTLQLSTTGTYRETIVWSSSNPVVASVNQTGLVTTHDGGTAIITASQGGFTATCEVEVDKYALATDADFSGETDGTFKYIGTDDYVEVPHVIKGVPVTSYSYMFGSTGVEGVKSTNSNIINMEGMFHSSKATSLDLSSFDTSNVTNMISMFFSSAATTLDLSNFDTSNVTDMRSMFNSSAATTLDLSSFNTSNVTDMNNMFAYSAATTLDLSSFNTSNVTNMNNMFSGSVATSLDLSSFNTSNVTGMAQMFNGSQVATLDLSSFDTSSVTGMVGMFQNSKVSFLDISNFNTSKIESFDLYYMFQNVSASVYVRNSEEIDRLRRSYFCPGTVNFYIK